MSPAHAEPENPAADPGPRRIVLRGGRLPDDPAPPRDARARAGLALIAIGLLAVAWGVLHVLEAANGPGFGPTRFEESRGYDQTKEDVHRALPGGLVRATAGLVLALAGGLLRRRPQAAETA